MASNAGAVLGSMAAPLATTVAQGLFGGIHARKANDRNIENWHLQNAYNHPTEQMKRLQEAGLNPALMYGGSASGASGQAGSPPPTEKPDTPDMALPQFLDVKRQRLEIDNLKKYGRKLVAEKEAIDARKVSTIHKNFMNRFNEPYAQDLAQWSNDILYHKRDKSLSDAGISNETWQLARNTAPERSEIVRQQLKQLRGNITLQEAKQRLADIEAEWAEQGLRKNDPWFVKSVRDFITDNPNLSNAVKAWLAFRADKLATKIK